MNQKQGLFFALSAYITWGFFPLYWKLLAGVEPHFILAHRMLWSLFVTLIGVTLARSWQRWLKVLRHPKLVFMLFLAGICIGANWYIYIRAVNSGHVLASSLGYFMNPIMNVMVGVIFLHERLNRFQWAAVALALGGVVNTALYAGPQSVFIAVSLAVTFCLYGLVHKLTPAGSLTGFATETLCLFPFTVCYLIWERSQGAPVWGTTTTHAALLVLGGLVTTIPLLFFSAAASRLPLSMLGFFQYISPLMQFFMGIYLFKEPLDSRLFLSFTLVWAALALFTYDAVVRMLRSKRKPSNVILK